MEFKENNKPIYLQIAYRIADEIMTGKYAPDERIPSVREYALEVEVNMNTVVRSYEYLQNNKVIYNKRGIGFFVEPDAKQTISAIRREAFMRDVLPEFFNEIKILGIDIDEIVALFRKQE